MTWQITFIFIKSILSLLSQDRYPIPALPGQVSYPGSVKTSILSRSPKTSILSPLSQDKYPIPALQGQVSYPRSPRTSILSILSQDKYPIPLSKDKYPIPALPRQVSYPALQGQVSYPSSPRTYKMHRIHIFFLYKILLKHIITKEFHLHDFHKLNG